MTSPTTYAPGWPGSEPRWTSSAKTGVGTALSNNSRVWFTLSHGILNEVYYPRLDTPCTRDVGLIVTGDDGYFSEEKRHANTHVSYPCDGVPFYRLTNACRTRRYRIEKDVLADPLRDVVLQRTRFIPNPDVPGNYHLYLLAAPHLGNRGWGNSGWVDDYKGIP
ncbi:MAG: hypothetical protein ACRET1_07390, partial [Burkholderiales bacterium]